MSSMNPSDILQESFRNPSGILQTSFKNPSVNLKMSIASTEPNERKDESPVISIDIFKVNQLIDKHRIAWIHSGTKPNEKNKNKQTNKQNKTGSNRKSKWIVKFFNVSRRSRRSAKVKSCCRLLTLSLQLRPACVAFQWRRQAAKQLN